MFFGVVVVVNASRGGGKEKPHRRSAVGFVKSCVN